MASIQDQVSGMVFDVLEEVEHTSPRLFYRRQIAALKAAKANAARLCADMEQDPVALEDAFVQALEAMEDQLSMEYDDARRRFGDVNF